MVQLYGDERLDYLLDDETMKIIQSPSVFSFSLDAVLLAKFVYVPIQKGQLMDLCTGNGVVPLFLSKRTKGQLYGVEIQERLHGMAERSIAYNELTDRITIYHDDLNNLPTRLGHGKFDVITCNPPYFLTPKASERNENEHYAIARHEIMCTLEDTIRVSSQLVKQGGKVAFVHRPDRLLDIVTLMRHYRIEPKRLLFVHPKEGKEANMLLIEGTKDGQAGLKVLPPLFVYDEQQQYTEQLKAMIYEQ